jgi:hypothetical protein
MAGIGSAGIVYGVTAAFTNGSIGAGIGNRVLPDSQGHVAGNRSAWRVVYRKGKQHRTIGDVSKAGCINGVEGILVAEISRAAGRPA